MTLLARHFPKESDRDLLAAVAAGERLALEQLYLAYHRRLARFFARFTPAYEHVEESINDTFLSVWRSAKDFRDVPQVSTWILAIAYRTALRSIRRQHHGAAGDDYRERSPDRTSDTELRDGLKRLPAQQRLILEFSYAMGLSLEAIAAITECPVGTVQAHMCQVRERLRQYGPRGEEAAANRAGLMSEPRARDCSFKHEQLAALIPWYVNDTLPDAARARVEEHLHTCAACREEMSLQQHIRAGMSVDGALEFMPAASLNRLRSMLDGESAAAGDAIFYPGARRRRPLRWLAAASVAGVIALAVLLAAGRWRLSARSDTSYHTVTGSAPHSHEDVVHAVFVPTITLMELQGLLDEAQLRIVSGPTEAGVYSLAAKSNLPTSTSLALLRRHAMVRFAASVEPAQESSVPR